MPALSGSSFNNATLYALGAKAKNMAIKQWGSGLLHL